jgi:hypothetical protein
MQKDYTDNGLIFQILDLFVDLFVCALWEKGLTLELNVLIYTSSILNNDFIDNEVDIDFEMINSKKLCEVVLK